MPAVLAAPWLGTAIAGVAGAGGAVAAGKIAANATNKGAKLSTDAANRAAELQDAASQRAEAFQREQAAQDQARFEASQRANYAQYVNRARAAQGLGRTIGFDLPDPPAYETSLPPGASRGASTGTSTPPAVNWTAPPDQLAAQLTSYFQAKGAPATEVPYWVSKAGELVARGQEINDPEYANKRLAAAEILGGGGSASPMGSRSIASLMSNRFTIPTPPVEPFQLRSINAFVRR